MIAPAAAVGLAKFAFVFLKTFQQRSVIHNTRWAILPTSMVMAIFEVFVYASIAKAYLAHGWQAAALIAIAMGAGGGTGCLLAMALHDRIMGGRA